MAESSGTGGTVEKRPMLPPSWFIRIAWAVHRAIFRWTGGRRGLWRATPEKWGTFRLHTVGRRSGKERIAILGYHEDGPNIVTVAMNGWMEGDPAWWVNLQAHPDATIELKGRTIAVTRARPRARSGSDSGSSSPTRRRSSRTGRPRPRSSSSSRERASGAASPPVDRPR